MFFIAQKNLNDNFIKMTMPWAPRPLFTGMAKLVLSILLLMLADACRCRYCCCLSLLHPTVGNVYFLHRRFTSAPWSKQKLALVQLKYFGNRRA